MSIAEQFLTVTDDIALSTRSITRGSSLESTPLVIMVALELLVLRFGQAL